MIPLLIFRLHRFGTVVNYTTLKGKCGHQSFGTVVNYTTLITPFGVFYIKNNLGGKNICHSIWLWLLFVL